MKKILLYSTIVLALGACKNGSTTKADDKGTTGTTTTSGDKGTTTTGTNTGSTTMETPSGSWSSADKNMFMTTCTDKAAESMGENKAKDYCSCMLDKIEVKYPNSADAGNMTTNETTDMAKDCLNMK